jgi:16S rRNA processing protein RimM
MKSDVLRIGVIVRSHGIKGEVKIQPLTDDANRFGGLTSVILERNGAYADVRITVNRVDGNGVFAYIEGCYTKESAEALKDAYLCVHRSDAIVLDKDSWFIDDLVGLRVNCEDTQIGTLAEVIQTGGVDVYRVEKTGGGELLFPALKKVIRSVDIDNGVMALDAMALSEVRVDED